MRVTPPGGGSPVNAGPIGHHSAGLALWQVTLIAFAGVVLVAMVLMGALRIRFSRRTASTPATS
jgi:hypothetical protein